MATTEYINVKGKVKWFKYQALDKYGKWSHQMWLDPESLEKMRELQAEGAKNVIHKDDDGYYVTFSRRPFIERKDGSKTPLAPPVVTKDEKTFMENVGNNSDVTTTLEVYQHFVPNSTKKAKAIRWYASRIDNLIPYTRVDLTPEEAKIVEMQSKTTHVWE